MRAFIIAFAYQASAILAQGVHEEPPKARDIGNIEFSDPSPVAQKNRDWQKFGLMLLGMAPSDAFVAPTGLASNPRFGASRKLRFQQTFTMDAEADTEVAQKEAVADDGDDDEACSIDNLDACSQQELEMMYVDELWSYYSEGVSLATDEQYDDLVRELNWQGSGFPSLRRNEVAFLEAALAFAKGEPIVSDEKWQQMKQEVKDSSGKRKEVTSFLLYTKSMREVAGVREKLEKEMGEAGIEMQISPGGISCTLSETSTALTNNVADVLYMYVALSAVPTVLASLLYLVLGLLVGGPEFIGDTFRIGFALAGVASFAATRELINYVELATPLLLEGVCPCCESKIAYMSSNWADKKPGVTCAECSSDLEIDVVNRQLGKAQGITIVGSENARKGRWIDDAFTKAALLTSDVVLGKPRKESYLGGGKFGRPAKPAPGTTAFQYAQEHVSEGLFAWLILVGYSIFGEKFIGLVRGKGIALHSQAINAFCKRFFIPKKHNQLYIQTAKRNGHDLGFLVDGQKLFGDGIVGKQAVAWWKENI